MTGESSYTGSAGASMPGRVDECYAAPWIDPLAKQQLPGTVSRVMSRSWGDGRYVATSLLGRGGTAEVWRATDRVLHRDVAVKAFLAGDPSVGEDDEARFRSEVNLLAQLNHPHIVALWDAGVTDRQPWCSMAYIDGGTLAHWSGQRTPVDVADLGIQLADALVYLHACGVVHRDLKPANILIDHQGRAYLSDFGIARLSSATRITSTGVLIGTAAYLAPEQVRGEAVGVPADIYSLGLVLLEQLTGRREYDGTAVEAAIARLSRPPVIPKGLDPGWQRLLAAMTAGDIANRCDARQVGQALASIRDGRQLPPLPAAAASISPSVSSAWARSVPSRLAAARHAHRLVAAAVIVGTIGAAGGITARSWHLSTADAEHSAASIGDPGVHPSASGSIPAPTSGPTAHRRTQNHAVASVPSRLTSSRSRGATAGVNNSSSSWAVGHGSPSSAMGNPSRQPSSQDGQQRYDRFGGSGDSVGVPGQNSGSGNWQDNQSGNWQDNQSGNWQDNQSGNWQGNGSGNWQDNGSGNGQDNQSGNWQSPDQRHE